MTRRGTVAVARNEFRLVRRDPTFLVMMIGMPLIIIPILRTVVGPALEAEGLPPGAGDAQVVTGQAVLFAFFMVGMTGFAFFREHGWNTWDRLRASPARNLDIIVGKAVPWFTIGIAQLATVIGVGAIAFDVDLSASPLGLVLLGAAYVATLVSLAVLLVAVLHRMPQLNAVSNLGAMVFGAIGGAFVPADQLPGWAQAIAPATPTYWVMRGMNDILIEGDGLEAVWLPVAVLVVFAAGFALLAARRFRFDEAKRSWA